MLSNSLNLYPFGSHSLIFHFYLSFENLPELDLPHVKTSADVTIRQLRKFIASQVGLNQEESALVNNSSQFKFFDSPEMCVFLP